MANSGRDLHPSNTDWRIEYCSGSDEHLVEAKSKNKEDEGD